MKPAYMVSAIIFLKYILTLTDMQQSHIQLSDSMVRAAKHVHVRREHLKAPHLRWTSYNERREWSEQQSSSRQQEQLPINSHVNRTRTVSAIGYMVNQHIKLLGHWLTSWHTPLWGCKCLISIKLELFGLQSFLGCLSLPPLRVLSEVTHWHPTENEKRANFSSRCTEQSDCG